MKYLEQSSSQKQQVEQRSPVAGWRGSKQLPFDGCAVSEKQDEKVLEKDGGDGSAALGLLTKLWLLNALNATKLYTEKNG